MSAPVVASPHDLLFDELTRRSAKATERKKLQDQRASLETQLKQNGEQIAVLDAQIEIHEAQARKYARELAGGG